nr:unnamed protein product [Timema douglasi]
MQDRQALWSSREKLSPTTTAPEGVRVSVPIPDLQSRRLGGGGKALVPSRERSTVGHPRTRYNPRSKTCVLQGIGRALRMARHARLALSISDMLALSCAQSTCVASRVLVGRSVVFKTASLRAERFVWT